MPEREPVRSAAPGASGPPSEIGAEISTRPMQEKDLPAVLRIERRSFPNPWSERTFRGLLRRGDSALLVAEDREGNVLGYAALWISGSEAELGDLAVRSDARRRGVGRALLWEAMAAAARLGAAAVFLEVRTSNLPARRLYEAAGFERVGTHPGYYERPREDALVLRRPLDELSGGR